MIALWKLLMWAGALLLAAGLTLILLGGTNTGPLGRLPGDLVYRGKNTTVFFPLGTSILLSIVISLALYLANRFHR